MLSPCLLPAAAVRRVPRAFEAEVFWLLSRDEPRETRSGWVNFMLAAARRENGASRGLMEARRHGQLVGAVWGQVLPGRVCNVWPPRLADREPTATADRLLGSLERPFRSQGVQVVQALLRNAAGCDAEIMLRHAYRPVADLLYLVSTRTQFPFSHPASCVEFETYGEQCRDRMSRIVEETYVGTLDIPALNGMRRMSDVLEGYASVGVYDPGRWFFVKRNGRDIGCLLLADHPAADQWELIYMGLIPSVRGHRWGLEIVHYAQRLTRDAGRSALILAVDSANWPALGTYARAGFFECDRRSVFFKA